MTHFSQSAHTKRKSCLKRWSKWWE